MTSERAGSAVTVRVPAKINLQLAVGPLRADGYHDLVTVFHAVSLCDEIAAEPADQDRVTVSGEGADRVPADGDNLALRAVTALRGAIPDGPGVHITISKRIPVAAGLAGGSADAAAALVACNELWDGGLSQPELLDIAATVGSDVAFALLGGTAVGRGRGEQLTPALAPATPYHWVLALADGQLSTPAVYAALDKQRAARAGRPGAAGPGTARPGAAGAGTARPGGTGAGTARPGAPGAGTASGPAGGAAPALDAALMSALRSGRASQVGRALTNDLQPAALSLFPALRKTLAAGLELGALGALVSGSGPTCVFLAANAKRALDLAVSLSGAGVCRSVARVTGPVPGAAVVGRPEVGRVEVTVANLISLEKAAKAYAHRTLLDGISLGISAGERIGVVGRNGAGKSTLLGLLAGRVTPDTGRVAMTSGLRVGYLSQRDELSGTVGEIVFSEPVPGAVPGNTPWEADPRARAIMTELLPGVSLDAPAGRLSGGERRRVALAALLVAERDVLLLDEPTNHLDIEAIDWLGRHLRSRGSAVVVVSHDRWLLDTVCDRTWEVDRGQVHSAEGGYSAYVLAEAERERAEDASERRRRNLARKELAWLQRGAKARTTKAKFRVEAANALIADVPPVRDSVELTRLATARLGKTVLELEDVSVAVGDGAGERVLLDQVTWQLGPGDRVGVVGVNGSGKTSLLNVLAEGGRAEGGLADGELANRPGLHESGTVIRGKTVRLAYLSQELAELDPDQRVRDAVEEVRVRIQVGDHEQSAGQLLERLGFPAERQRTRIGDLSGGERRRVQLLRLLMDEPNVLMLDEPTNDLDIETLTELEDLLDGWPGTLVVVSHDRYFLERVTEHVVALLGHGQISFLAGGVDEYLDRMHTARAPAPRPSAATASTAGTAQAAGPTAAQERTARKELQRLERQLDRLTQREATLSAELAANASDYEKLTSLGAELRTAQDEKADLEERWLTVAADLE